MRYTYILIFIFIFTLITSSGYKSSTEQSYNNNFENESKLINNTLEDISFPSNFSKSDSFLTHQTNCDIPSNSSGILCITTSSLNGVVVDQTQKFLIVIESTGGNPNPQQISVTGQELKDIRVEVPPGTYSVLVKQQTNVGDVQS